MNKSRKYVFIVVIVFLCLSVGFSWGFYIAIKKSSKSFYSNGCKGIFQIQESANNEFINGNREIAFWTFKNLNDIWEENINIGILDEKVIALDLVSNYARLAAYYESLNNKIEAEKMHNKALFYGKILFKGRTHPFTDKEMEIIINKFKKGGVEEAMQE